MTSAPVESRTWPRARWWLLIALIFVGQVAFIFWLAARNTEAPPSPPAESAIYLPADQTSDLPGVSDPTLFVLPARHSFSEAAWMQFAASSYRLEPWTEPTRPLPLTIPQLGATLAEYVRTNQPRPFELALNPPPEVDALGSVLLEEAPSTYRIEGDLADRELLVPLKLQSWPATDILTDTVVQIAVDAAGRVISAALIARCASADANASALGLARRARFQPLRWVGTHPPPPEPGGLSWGKIIFHWQTVGPASSTAASNK